MIAVEIGRQQGARARAGCERSAAPGFAAGAGEKDPDAVAVRERGGDIDAAVAIEIRRRHGKTYYAVTDVSAFRAGVARLLADVQRIKGEGDYAGAHALFEAYGIHLDPVLRDEIVARVDVLSLPSYTGFVMPRLDATYGTDGAIVDVRVSYPCDLEAQMLDYAARTARDAVAERGEVTADA